MDDIAAPVPAPDSLDQETDEALGSLQIRPEKVSFATQDEDEDIFLLTRRDVITNLGWALQVGFSSLIPVLVVIIIRAVGLDINSVFPLRFQVLAILVFYGVLLTFAVFKFNEWYYNVFVVTNKRIITFRFNPLTRYKVAEAELRNIQDVSESVIGLFPSLFNYGDILIQTAAQKGKFKITQVPKVTWLRDVLVDLARAGNARRR